MITGAILSLFAMMAADPAAMPQKAEERNDPARWVRPRDLPPINEQAAVTTFDLTIGANGRPTGCTIIIASGSDTLDTAVCNTIVRQARFNPAIGSNGEPAVSVQRNRLFWKPQGGGGSRSYDAADVVVSSPEIAQSPSDLTEIILEMDATGAVTQCLTLESGGDESLDNLACEIAKNPDLSLPITDASGESVSGIRTFFFTFEPAEESQIRIR